MRILTNVLLVLISTGLTAVCTAASAGPPLPRAEVGKAVKKQGAKEQDAKDVAKERAKEIANDRAKEVGKDLGKDDGKQKKNANEPQPGPQPRERQMIGQQPAIGN
jgi:hypothetical protein